MYVRNYTYLHSTLLLQFPALKDSVYGEESGKFCMHGGSETVVEVCATVQETESMLTSILGDERRGVAQLLATKAHSEVPFAWSHHEDATCCELKEMGVDLSHLGVWIDPIGELCFTQQVAQCTCSVRTHTCILRDAWMVTFHCKSSLLNQSNHEN